MVKEIGSVCNTNVSVIGATCCHEGVCEKIITLTAYDGCDKEIEVLLSQSDCIELIGELSKAYFCQDTK